MDGEPKGMAQKRDRHYPETNTVIAVAMMLFGACSAFVLILVWPQVFSVEVFNSRLSYSLIVDVEDYFTCDNSYVDFVIDEPTSDYAMLTMYVFNVTNAADVFLIGFKPRMVETGPYGFVKYTYKYDIAFDDQEKSETVSFKEYSLLQEIVDPEECELMYYRLERDALQDDPCPGDSCKCQPYDSTVTIVNPLMLKTIWEESPTELLAHYSVDVFDEIKTVLEDPFTEAVKAHLVADSYREIYTFRSQMQVGKMFITAVDNLQTVHNFTLEQIADEQLIPAPAQCGLDIYGISNACPFRPFTAINSFKRNDLNDSDYPSMLPFFDISNNASILNLDYGLPKWLGLSWYFGYAEVLNTAGYTSVTREELEQYLEDFAVIAAEHTFGSAAYTDRNILAAKRLIEGLAFFIDDTFLRFYEDELQSLVFEEFVSSSELVPCGPTTQRCIWQWGYMADRYGADFEVDQALTISLIDPTKEINTNPNSLYLDLNAPLWYNSFSYCSEVRFADPDVFDITCTNLEYSLNDGIITRPAGLWGTDFGVSASNLTFLHVQYQKQSSDVQEYYLNFACNMSKLLHDVYRTETSFHDDYVMRYVNKYKDPELNHTFTVGKWNDLGIAQWAGGFITQALANVRTTNQIVRDGMWRIGQDNYYENLIEYSSWAVRQGYTDAWIYSLDDARTLLHALARRDDIGVQLREHIAYRGTTFFGDGVNFVNSVGELGEVTFTKEANRGNFSCEGTNEPACAILDVFYESSTAQCFEIQALFEDCEDQFVFENNRWIEFDKCATFETSQTSPTVGIQCDGDEVFGQNHPYRKSRGNIVFQMLYAYTIVLQLQEGFWCATSKDCDFTWGGMFATTTARKLLFNGYTEPSMLKYLNLKHQNDNISFECGVNAFDQCGKQNYRCDSTQIIMNLPNGARKVFEYGNTSSEEFFAPELYVAYDTGDLIWPYANNKTLARIAEDKLYSSNVTIVQVRNPHWSAFPAWLGKDVSFNKYYQCQKRLYMGPPDQFPSCTDSLYTGRDRLNNTMNIKTMHGNDTVFHYGADAGQGVNGSTINNQYPPYLWKGFKAYPYNYLGRTSGAEYKEMKSPHLYSKLHGMSFQLYQDSLLFEFQREIKVEMPLRVTPEDAAGQSASTFPAVESKATRRFVEDEDTWRIYKRLGVPTDSFGMPFRIPTGMHSLTRMAGFPLYADTPHSYGNEKWGGLEYTFVTGTEQNELSQRTYVDYDPVTGQALRSVLRQQITLRIEAGPLFPNAFSSQERCVVPTNIFTESSGYGCFAYVPLFWWEDSRTMDSETFFRIHDHYYTRPDRAEALTYAGITLCGLFMLTGMVCFTNEWYHKRRFQ